MTLVWAFQSVAQTPSDFGALVNLGAVGIVLAWFMWRTEPRLERIERAMDRFTRAQLIEALYRPGSDESAKRMARQMLREMGFHDEGLDGDDA